MSAPGKERVINLGQCLLAFGWITETHLEQALAKQSRVGGRLGTCLLETGVLTESLLLRALAEQQGVASASATDLRDIPRDVVDLMPREVAVSHHAVPFHRHRKEVSVAVEEMGGLALEDDLSFALGLRVKLFVACEVRIREALARYYGEELSPRFRTLLTQLARQKDQSAAQVAVAKPRNRPVALEGSETRAVGTPRKQPFEPRAKTPVQRSIPLTDEQRHRLLRARQTQARAGIAGDVGAAAAPAPLERLAHAHEIDEIADALLAALERVFVRTLLFRVDRGLIRGWTYRGPDINTLAFESFSVPLRRPTVFLELQSARQSFRGRLKKNAHHLRLARCWGGGLANECVLVPILVRSRLVCAIYGDRGQAGLTDIEIGPLNKLATKAGLAFERSILERKAKK